jgi:hypothetical protein
MRVPPPRPGSPRDTLDDVDRQLDAVHELTDPVDALHEEPTDLMADGTRTEPLGPREVPTGPAEPRTAPWMHATPWAGPERRPDEKRDPWLLPVLVFVLVLIGCIVMFLYQETHKLPH